MSVLLGLCSQLRSPFSPRGGATAPALPAPRCRTELVPGRLRLHVMALHRLHSLLCYCGVCMTLLTSGCFLLPRLTRDLCSGCHCPPQVLDSTDNLLHTAGGVYAGWETEHTVDYMVKLLSSRMSETIWYFVHSRKQVKDKHIVVILIEKADDNYFLLLGEAHGPDADCRPLGRCGPHHPVLPRWG